jgi:hypothetical protein
MTLPAQQPQREHMVTDADFDFIWKNIHFPLIVRDRINVIKSRPHTPAPTSEEYESGFGDGYQEGKKFGEHKATLAIKDWACKHRNQVAAWNDGLPFIWWYELRDELDRSLRTQSATAGGAAWVKCM